MKTQNTKAMKVYPDDELTLRRICARRLDMRIDRKELTPARMLKAALRIPKVKDILLKAEIRNVK